MHMKHVLLSLALALVTTIGNATCLYVHNASEEQGTVTWVKEADGLFIPPTIQCSKDGGVTWSDVTYGVAIPIARGSKIHFRGNNATCFSKDNRHYVHLRCTRSFTLGGDVTSLLNGVGDVSDLSGYEAYLFYGLFAPFTVYSTDHTLIGLESDFSLPSTILTDYCYCDMFAGCVSLKNAPVLSSKKLAAFCYADMFIHCASLTDAPKLPAMDLMKGCYSSMFGYCTSIAVAPQLPAITLAEGCYEEMFNGCTSLKSSPVLPATTIAEDCYNLMFSGCTSLTNAPVLPAMTLVRACYASMFYNCTSLVNPPELPAETLAESCYYGMFYGCTSLTDAPFLPAMTLEPNCYDYMFSGCKLLNAVKVVFSSWIDGATDYWLDDVALSGSFSCPETLDVSRRGPNNIPTAWDVKPIAMWEIGAAGNESGIKAWTNSTGRLIITGSGAMTNFANAADVPWNPDVVLEVECGSAITPIGKNVFAALGDAVLVNGVAAGEIRHAFGITADEAPVAAVTAEFEKIAIENGKADFVIKVKKTATLEEANWDSATLTAVGIDGCPENGRVKVTVSAEGDKGFYVLGFKKVGEN